MLSIQDVESVGLFVKVRHNREYKTDLLDRPKEFNVRGGFTEVSIFKGEKLVSSGKSECSKKDNYNRKTGTKIALKRAVKKLLRNIRYE